MAGRRNLSVLHTALAVGLAEGKCSPALCLPHEPSPYAVRFSIPEWQNGGDCQFRTRSRQSVWQKVNTLPFSACRFSIPEWRGGGICQSCTRRWRSVWQKANALPRCACRTSRLRMPCAFLYPNGGAAESVSPARGAGGQFGREQMFSRVGAALSNMGYSFHIPM